MPDTPALPTRAPVLSAAVSAARPRTPVAPAPFRVAAFDGLTRVEAVELVRSCFEVERWWTAVVDGRPYGDLESLLAVARRSADPLTRTELDLALGAHLGARDDDWLPEAGTDRYGAAASTAALVEQVAEASRVYLARFDRPFVIRTTGRSLAEVAAHLDRRLGHDAAIEDRLVAWELRQIGLLALVRRVRR